MGEKFEDAMLLALKTEEGPRANEYRQLLEAGKGQETDRTFRTFRKNIILLTN